MASETAYPVDGLVHALRSGARASFTARCAEARFVERARILAQTPTDLSLRPVRGPGDWSIATLFRCTCRLCGTLAEFLRDPARRQFEWPLAKDHRAHVHQIIDSHDLAVSHVTRRVGPAVHARSDEDGRVTPARSGTTDAMGPRPALADENGDCILSSHGC